MLCSVLRCLVLDVSHSLSLFFRVVLGFRGDAFLSVCSGFSVLPWLQERPSLYRSRNTYPSDLFIWAFAARSRWYVYKRVIDYFNHFIYFYTFSCPRRSLYISWPIDCQAPVVTTYTMYFRSTWSHVGSSVKFCKSDQWMLHPDLSLG